MTTGDVAPSAKKVKRADFSLSGAILEAETPCRLLGDVCDACRADEPMGFEVVGTCV